MDKHRQWTQEEARQLLARAERKGQSLSELARELGVNRQRLAYWQKRLDEEAAGETAGFVEVTLKQEGASQPFAVQTRSHRKCDRWPGGDAGQPRRPLAMVEGEANDHPTLCTV
ncbi:IS66 family insertion sequence element accessory protein TnpA [Haliangium sp.]|uniref:IS66 family insertion sequence element accessory protein TnpA n=1 Tax=Haliangium sp. TaxID=2663208 RepID=UPI003D133631